MKERDSESSLENFSFDGDDVFKEFMSPEDAPPTPTVVKGKTQISASGRDPFGDDDDDEEVEEGPTKLGPEKTKPSKKEEAPVPAKPKPKAAASKKEQEEEVLEEDGEEFEFSFTEESQGAEPKPKKKAVAAKKKEEVQEQEAEEEVDEEREEVVVGEDFYNNLALDLKEMGTFQAVEIPTDKKLTAEEFLELHEAEIEARFNEAIEAFAEEMDADGKALIKFMKNGGKTSDFIRQYLAPTFTLKEFDEDNKQHISMVIDHYLRTVEALDGEDLADRKEWLKTSGKEKNSAKTYFEKIQKADERRQTAIQRQVEAQNKADEEEAQAFNETLIDIIGEMKGVGDFTLSDTDRKELPAYMTKPTVKVGKNKFVPRLHAELGKVLKGATQQDRERYIILAKIFNSGFKIPNLKTALETKVTKEAKLRIKKSSPQATTGSSARKRSLADMMDE